jgi:hypothetical protein
VKLKLNLQASNRGFFKGLHFWLLLSKTLVSNDDPLMIVMKSLRLRLDSQVTLSHPGAYFSQVVLQDIYRLTDQSLTVTPPRDWNPGRLLPHATRKEDFKEIVLKAGVAVSIRGCASEH